MCGIYAIFSFNGKNYSKQVYEGLKRMEYRGYDSWGITAFSANQKFRTTKNVGPISDSKYVSWKSNCVIGHTRWATHGAVTSTNSHPHFDCKQTLAIVHNGVVENFEQLKAIVIGKKHVLKSQTDTELVAHLLEKTVAKCDRQKIIDVFKRIDGKNALVIADVVNQKLYAYCQNMPLIVGLDEGCLHIASDLMAIKRSITSFIFLQNGQLFEANAQGYAVYDAKTGLRIKQKIEKITRHFPKTQVTANILFTEIVQQQKTLSVGLKENMSGLKKIAQEIKNENNVIFIGCGSAYYAGLFGQYFLGEKSINSLSLVASQVHFFEHLFHKNSLVIALSQSGETADTIEAVEYAKSKGAKIVLLVNAPKSRLEKLADIAIPLGVGQEKAVASTKAFTKQVYLLFLISQLIQNPNLKIHKHAANLEKLISNWLNESLFNQVKKITAYCEDKKSIFIIGSGKYYPVALEIALKLKENSLIHAEAIVASELKHGPLSLVDEKVLVLAIYSDANEQPDVSVAVSEIESRKGNVVQFCNHEEPADTHPNLILDKEMIVMILQSIIAGQLLSYYMAINKGINPDRPRNLAKSVTVR